MTEAVSRFPANTVPVVAFAATTATALLAAPAIARQLSSQFGLSPSDIGLYFTVELAGMSLATVPAFWWLNRIAWRHIGAIAMGVFILANLLSTQSHAFHWLLALRAVSSLSGGTLMVLSMTLAGRSTEAERLFAFWTLGQLIVGASLLYALPRLFDTGGLSVLYWLIAALMAANIPLLCYLPASVQTPPAKRGPGKGDSESLPTRSLILGVGGVLFYYIGFGGLWPFLGAIAQSGGASAIATGTVLALAGLAGLKGALIAAARARHDGWRTLAIGYAVHAVGLLALLYQPGLARFAIAACLLKGASNFTLPFILGRTARLDRDGRLMGFTNMAIGGGLAIGPLITGKVIESTGGFGALIAISIAWFAASALLTFSIGARPRAAILSSPTTAHS